MQQTAPIRGPLVWRDMDQKTLDDAYDQAGLRAEPRSDPRPDRDRERSGAQDARRAAARRLRAERARKARHLSRRTLAPQAGEARVGARRSMSSSMAAPGSAAARHKPRSPPKRLSVPARTPCSSTSSMSTRATATSCRCTEQVSRAIAWAWSNAESFGGDRNRFYVSAHSSGAHLAACALSRGWRAEESAAGFLQGRAAGRRHVRS